MTGAPTATGCDQSIVAIGRPWVTTASSSTSRWTVPDTGAGTSAATLSTWTSAIVWPASTCWPSSTNQVGQHALGLRLLGRQRREEDLGHPPSTLRIAASMRAGPGSTTCSSGLEYGTGVSGLATRTAAARSIPGSCSVIVATTSPDSPKER